MVECYLKTLGEPASKWEIAARLEITYSAADIALRALRCAGQVELVRPQRIKRGHFLWRVRRMGTAA